MKIIIDGTKMKDFYSGLGQYSYHFIDELLNQEPSLDIHVYGSKPPQTALDKELFIHASFLNRVFPQSLPKSDIWHSLFQYSAYQPKRQVQILTVHDLNFLRDKSKTKQQKYLRRLQKECDNAIHVICISQFTQKELLDNIKIEDTKTSVIYNGIKAFKGTIKKPLFTPEKEFLFSLGVFKSTKRFDSLVKMMEGIQDKELIIAGNYNTPYGKQVKDLINQQGLQDRVHLVGIIPEEEKQWYLQHCAAFVFPSITEGFGMPVVEAMLHGKKCILSNESSLPEIGQDKAYYFKDLELDQMVNAVEEALSDDNFDAQAVIVHAKQFTWERNVEETMGVYRKVMGK